MCKKLTKLAKENDSMKEELLKYRSLYGDLDAALSAEELADAPHSRETELKVHLKLVEEEANLLSRRIVELEVENRGLRAEMDDMKDHGGGGGPEARLAFSALGGECGESLAELRRHLQFVEEEAELLRRSSAELEDQNKLLLNELAKYRSEHELDVTLSEDSCSVLSEPSQEELAAAKLQIGELSGKVKKLQYENRVLLSNLQRCDLASCQSTRPMLETDAEAGDSAQCVPAPLGEALEPHTARLCRAREAEALPGLREQAALVSKAIDVLVADANGFSVGLRLCLDNECADLRLHEAPDNSEGPRDAKLIHAILVRLSVLQQELNTFTRKVDVALGSSGKEQPEPFPALPALGSQGSSKEIMLAKDLGSDFQVRCPGQGPVTLITHKLCAGPGTRQRRTQGHVYKQLYKCRAVNSDHHPEHDQSVPRLPCSVSLLATIPAPQDSLLILSIFELYINGIIETEHSSTWLCSLGLLFAVTGSKNVFIPAY